MNLIWKKLFDEHKRCVSFVLSCRNYAPKKYDNYIYVQYYLLL